MFASTTQSLSWPALAASHWSAGALLYACIILAIPSILLGTQQLSVLPEIEDIRTMSEEKIKKMKDSFLSSTPLPICANSTTDISTFVLFVWQAPRTFLAASLASFIGAMISIVISAVASKPGWNAEAKVRHRRPRIARTTTDAVLDGSNFWSCWFVHTHMFRYRDCWCAQIN